MKNLVIENINNFKLLTEYDTSKTLTENKKNLLLESSILGSADTLIKGAFGFTKGVTKKLGTKTIKTYTGKFGDETFEIIEDGGTYSTKNKFGGQTFSSDELKQIATKADMEGSTILKVLDGFVASKKNPELIEQVRDIAKKSMGEQADNAETIVRNRALKNKKNISPEEKIKQEIDTFVDETFSELDDFTKTLIKKHGFDENSIRKSFLSPKKGLIKKTLRFVYLRDIVQTLTTTFRKIITTDALLEKLIEKRALEFANFWSDALKNSKKITVNEAKRKYQELFDITSMKKELSELFINKNGEVLEELEKNLRNELKKYDWTDSEINGLLSKIRGEENYLDPKKMIDELEKMVPNEEATFLNQLVVIKNFIKEKIGYPDNSLITRTLDKWVKTSPVIRNIFKILEIPLNTAYGLLRNKFKELLTYFNLGIFTDLKGLLGTFTKYRLSDNRILNLITGVVGGYIELWVINYLLTTFINTSYYTCLAFFDSIGMGELLPEGSKNVFQNFIDELFRFSDPQFWTWSNAVPWGGEIQKKVRDLEVSFVMRIKKFLYYQGERNVVKDLEAAKKKAVAKVREESATLLNSKENEGNLNIYLNKDEKGREFIQIKQTIGFAIENTNDLLKFNKKNKFNFTKKQLESFYKKLLVKPCLNGDTTTVITNDQKTWKNLCAGYWEGEAYYELKPDGEIIYYINNNTRIPIQKLLQPKKEGIKTTTTQAQKQDVINKKIEKKLTQNQLVNPKTDIQTNKQIPPDESGNLNLDHYMKNLIKRIVLQEEEEKTLKMKDWDEIFTFQKIDDKNPGKYTDVKIKMDSVMDRMPHWRKKYNKQCEELENCDEDGEDDSFVRAVIDTHPDVVRILYTKGLANLTSSNDQEDLNEGLHSLLRVIREAKNVEVEVWSVYRHPSSPDKIWSLVKGDYKPKELSSMDMKMQQSPQNKIEKKKDSLDELKKKELDAIKTLSLDEKKGLQELPIKVRDKVKEKIKRGWTTEKPSEDLIDFFKLDNIDSVFNEKIKIYKLKPNTDFFKHLDKKTFDVNIKRGFCRSLYYVEKELDLSKEKLFKVEEILSKCENKFDGKYGQNYL